MKGTTLIKAEIGNYKENELIFSSKLYKDLLYTDERQDFDKAITTFSEISALLSKIGE